MTRGVAFVSVGVDKCQSEDSCLFWRETHAKGLRARSPTRPEEDEGRKVPELNRRNQSRDQGSRQTRVVGRREQELGPVDSEAGLANVRGWVSVPGGVVGILLEYTLALVHRCTENHAKVSQNSPFLRLELNQVCGCLFSFLPPSRLCMLCFVCP